jgi:membrane-associated protease RseP (regulator of RpoE activity)
LVRKIKPNPVGGAPLVDNIGVKAKYHYAAGYEPVAVTYFDGRDRAIAIEVEVVGIEKGGVASAIGLLPGDRLLSYDGEKLRSVQRLVFLTGFPGEAPHKLSYRHGKKFFTVEVPSGRLGVEVKNARAAGAPKVVPSPEMQVEN